MRLFLLFLTALVTSLSLIAQTSNVDELLQQVKSRPDDSTKAAMLNRLGFIGNDYGLNERAFNEQALQLSTRLTLTKEKAKAILIRSTFLAAQGKPDSVLILIAEAQKTYPIRDSLKEAEYLGLYYFATGMASLHQGDNKDEVLHDFMTALHFSLQTTDNYLISVCYGARGVAYNYLRLFDKSVESAKEYVLFAESGKDMLILAKAYQNLGSAFQNAGDKNEAEKYYKKYEQLLPSLKSPYYTWLHKHNTALALANEGKGKEAIQAALETLEIAKNKLPAEKWLPSYYLIGYCYMLNKEYQLSNKYLEICQQLADSIHSKEYQMYAASGLATNYASLGEYKAAYENIDNQLALTDEISSDKIKINGNYLNIKYQSEKKEAQIKLQQVSIKQKNTLNYILLGSAVALLIISLLSYRNYRNRQKLQQQRISELETEKQLLATQSLLKGQEDERSRLAKDLHDGLGGLLSGVKLQLGAMKGNLILSEAHGQAFNNALNKLDDSISEMRRVAHNMMPEALINLGLQQALHDYCDGLSTSQPFTINCEFYGLEQRMEPSIEIVVYRIVQELLNNAVKHANATTILAQVIRRENNLTITVEDNGKGFDTTQLDQMRTAGLRNIQSRVNYLHGQIDIQSVPGKGTSVHIDCLIEDHG